MYARRALHGAPRTHTRARDEMDRSRDGGLNCHVGHVYSTRIIPTIDISSRVLVYLRRDNSVLYDNNRCTTIVVCIHVYRYYIYSVLWYTCVIHIHVVYELLEYIYICIYIYKIYHSILIICLSDASEMKLYLVTTLYFNMYMHIYT